MPVDEPSPAAPKDIDLGWGEPGPVPDQEASQPIVASRAPSDGPSNQQDTHVGLDELFGEPKVELWQNELGDPSTGDQGWSPSPVRARTEPESRPAAPAAVPPLETPVRPELFPAGPKKSRAKSSARKPVRIQAEPAEGQAVAAGIGLDDSLRMAMLAACSIPRPVFTRDLASIAGSTEIVSQWEDECRANPERGLRFIAPKARHRARGSLVVPSEELRPRNRKGSEDWWGTCTQKYLGAKLYELGVLLHRVGDELVSTEFGEQIAVLRLNSSRGLVGIVVILDDRLEKGEPARQLLAQALEELNRERLVLVAALTTLGDERDLARVVTAISELAAERSWQPSFPIVAARSWEYADDRGSTAHLVIGG